VKELGVTFNWNAAGVVLVHDGRKPPESNTEASHLCGHPWCVKAEHLIWETPVKNYARKNCNTWTVCPHCKQGSNPCKHTPCCLNMTNCACEWHAGKTNAPAPAS
jgi:hypothetical protein